MGNDSNGNLHILIHISFFLICLQYLGGQKVYDVTKYLEEHPGGPEIIMEFAGKDADDMFEDIGHSKEARATLKDLLVGTLKVRNGWLISFFTVYRFANLL